MATRDSTPTTHAADLAELVAQLVATADADARAQVATRVLATLSALRGAHAAVAAPTAQPTAEAAAGLFEELAGHCYSMAELFEALVHKPECAGAICMGGAALAAKAGYTAHKAAQALDDSPGVQGEDEWMMSPRSLQGLSTLRAARAEGGAA